VSKRPEEENVMTLEVAAADPDTISLFTSPPSNKYSPTVDPSATSIAGAPMFVKLDPEPKLRMVKEEAGTLSIPGDPARDPKLAPSRKYRT